MFTTLAVLFALFAADGFFRGRTLNDDWTTPNATKQRSRRASAWALPVFWAVLALISLFVGSRFEW